MKDRREREREREREQASKQEREEPKRMINIQTTENEELKKTDF